MKNKRETENRKIVLTVNGLHHELNIGSLDHEVDPAHTLAHTLRETLGLTGTKIGCDHGACGACTVIMDEKAVLSCKILTIECNGKSITTVEGLKNPETGELDPLLAVLARHSVAHMAFPEPDLDEAFLHLYSAAERS